MTLTTLVKNQEWFRNPPLQKIFKLFNRDGGEIRIAGGAVRNFLLGFPIKDIDMATTWLPEDVIQCAHDAGIKTVLTGFDHGTVTLVLDRAVFEVTTLREDIQTDGRRARVKFGTDWQRDAERRDLTINGLYMDVNGDIIDLVGGVPDIEAGYIRFIGDAEQRIKEDYLRVLRFFRFFAYYGKGRPDADGLKACAHAADKLLNLSVERIWKEMRLLFSAHDPGRALLWMRTIGVLTAILPETEKWGIDLVGPLVETKQLLDWENDPFLVLEAIIPPDIDRVSELTRRMKMSRLDKERLMAWVKAPLIPYDISETTMDRELYLGSFSGIRDVVRLLLVKAHSHVKKDENMMKKVSGYSKLLIRMNEWQAPQFPLTGQDLLSYGFCEGKSLGRKLKELEQCWIESHFLLNRQELLDKL